MLFYFMGTNREGENGIYVTTDPSITTKVKAQGLKKFENVSLEEVAARISLGLPDIKGKYDKKYPDTIIISDKTSASRLIEYVNKAEAMHQPNAYGDGVDTWLTENQKRIDKIRASRVKKSK